MKMKQVIIGSILVLFAIVIGSTLAWWTWTTSDSERTNIVVTVGGAQISYEDGENITNNNLIPTSTKEKGISKDITISSTSLVYLSLDMTIVTLDIGLKDASFKYGLYDSDDTPVIEGNFANSNANDVINLLENIEVSSTPVTYTLYIWIDGNMSNPNTMYNQNFNFVLSASATYEEPISNASEYIESLLVNNPNTMNNDDPDGNIRYMGADPNNYVSFNNELWRIIGVFDVATTNGGPTEKRIKIIRDESIGEYAWDKHSIVVMPTAEKDYYAKFLASFPEIGNGENNWSIASLQTYLNSDYYNALSSESRSLIGDAVWNLGGTASYQSSSNGLASHFYGYERGTTVYSGNPTYWIGKIGLMYPSDYGYATSGGSTTNRASCLAKELSGWNDSSYGDCKNNDYLFDSSSDQWTLMIDSSSSFGVFLVNTSGSITSSNLVDNTLASRPVIYLKSDVKITEGDGSSNSPFTLGI